jgi:ATP-dependent helicase/nuclease subunit A
MAEWIRYKLDRRFDHILVDEAQDTNAAQWGIVDALTSEFWAGLGQRDGRMRTLFVVGDYKQAIFRFQGTSPENFRRAADRVRGYMQGAVDNAAGQRSNLEPRPLLELGLDRSFRTARPILEFVDAAIDAIGHGNLGLSVPPEPHVGQDWAGQVVLWRPVGMASENDEDTDAVEGEEPLLSNQERDLADLIARQVRHWIDTGYQLVKDGKGKERPATAGDVMVLVRKRGELAALIVARLHAHGVPVAGVDRLRLGAPLAVKDLVAALRFAAQPFDDLNLASLLVSPLLGWSQEQLLEHGYRDKGVPLWSHLRQSAAEPLVAQTLDRLGDLLGKADFEPPQVLLHWLLSGPWQGRRKLVARLGREANDPIDELLNAAHAYATTATPSIVGFLAWFDAGEGELKREAESAGGLVRVMTVHGAKGLEAPIVILADACGNPDQVGKGLALDMPDPHSEERKLPLPPLRREERAGRIATEHAKIQQAEREEHWRLLYVAMTRAQEALFVGGALGIRDKGMPSPESWYAKLQQVFGDREWAKDDLWRECLRWGDAPQFAPSVAKLPELDLPPALPTWLKRPPPDDPRPPRPLAPSSLGEDLSSDPPYPPGGDLAAARRGVLIHKLLERLPEIPPDERRKTGLAWLARNAPGDDPESLLEGVLSVLEPEVWGALFSPAALAEVPIAATVGGRVIAGTIDRLLVEPDRIRLVDFKTTRRPPASLEEVSTSILRQMAAYACALEAAYPGRSVEAALLYTETPVLLEITADVLAQHKRALLLPE